MKLSKLVYLVVKNTKYLEDTGFSYEAFVNRDYDSDPDYINSMNNAMSPINEAIHRLSDMNKIAFKIYNAGCPTPDNIIHITDPNIRIKKIKSVFYIKKFSNTYISVGYREIGKSEIWVDDLERVNHFIQYIEDIKYFDRDDIYDSDTDVDLREYGISDTMCDYIIEYAQGRLQEIIAPELANLHVTRAEQYFNDLEEQQTVFSKHKVKRIFTIR